MQRLWNAEGSALRTVSPFSWAMTVAAAEAGRRGLSEMESSVR